VNIFLLFQDIMSEPCFDYLRTQAQLGYVSLGVLMCGRISTWKSNIPFVFAATSTTDW